MSNAWPHVVYKITPSTNQKSESLYYRGTKCIAFYDVKKIKLYNDKLF